MRPILLASLLIAVTTMASAKTERTYYDRDVMAEMREKIAQHDWAPPTTARSAATRSPAKPATTRG
jgi:hypothetical protein